MVFTTDDLLATRDHLTKLLWPHSIVPTERKARVRFRHCRAEIGRISINALFYGTAIRIHTYALEDTYLLLVLLRGTGRVSQGETSVALNNRNMYAFNPTQPARVDLSHGQMNFTIRIPGGAFREFIERETGKPMTGPFEFRMAECDAGSEVAGFRSLLHYVCAQVESADSSFDSPIVSDHLERALIGLLLTELPHNHPEVLGLEASVPAPAYIHKVEEYVATNYSRAITLHELCAAAAVSPRALQTGFRRFRSTTPMEYLRDYRLNLARTRLQSGPDYDKTITEIASDCGFSHLSKFAGHYRQRFNEAPSDTLKNARTNRS